MLDLGCGKGGAMITLRKYRFDRVDGLDISPEMIHIAEENFRRLGMLNVRVYCADAESFQDYDEYTYLYMFNPFTCGVVEKVLANILKSLDRRPRTLTIIYCNPVCGDALMSTGRFEKTAEFRHVRWMPIFVYKSCDRID